MRRFMINLISACMLVVLFSSGAAAIDFKIGGFFTMGFGVGETGLIRSKNGHKVNNGDDLKARQRTLIGLRAIAGDYLEGFTAFKMVQQWGLARQGAALGADGNVVSLAQANMAWTVPEASLKFLMGIQYVEVPAAAGGTSIFSDKVAGITANYAINEKMGVTALWMRPFNDNYAGGDFRANSPVGIRSTDPANYLDNMDLFMLALPMNFDALSVTPWVMAGMQGRNVPYFAEYYDNWFPDGAPAVTASPFLARLEGSDGLNIRNLNRTSRPYTGMFWAGLPVKYSPDPWHFEFDFNYGYVESLGRFDVARRNDWNDVRRGSWERKGWVAKALAEYATDWGKPGIFGWYGSGDDDNVKNGSERMPSICAYGNFTSFMGYGEGMDWETDWFYRAKSLSYAGTWGVGVFLRDVSFIKNVNHLLRVALWGGTNSPSMVSYMTSASAWESTTNRYDSLYLTTLDNLLEINFITRWNIYENLECLVDTGYIANFMNADVWKKSYNNFGSFEKKDAWKAQVVFQYSF